MAVKRLGNLEFLMVWVLANLLPWLAVCVIWAGLAALLDPYVSGLWNSLPFLVLGWCMACVAVGLAQWRVLRLRLTGMGWWPVATVMGSGAVLLFFPLEALLPQAPTPLFLPVLLGGGIGAAQWLVLRRRLPKTWPWVGIQIMAAVASIPAALVVPGVDFIMSNFVGSLMIMGGAMEVVAGLITGLGLLVLMQWAGR